MKFRKKPVTVEAMQWTGDNEAEIQTFASSAHFNAVDLEDRVDDPDITAQVYDRLHSTWVGVKDGQWIIRGVQGEFYPCDADVFTETYEDASAPLVADGSTSDGYHTFDELYEFRMLYHAAFVNTRHIAERRLGAKPTTVKALKHSDGEWCFGGGWFIVVTDLPGIGQISNHYETKHWDLFKVPVVDVPPAFDGHTPGDVAERLREFLEG